MELRRRNGLDQGSATYGKLARSGPKQIHLARSPFANCSNFIPT